MMWPVRMCKVRIIALKCNLRKTIAALEKYGGIEIKQMSSRNLANLAPLQEHQVVVERLIRLEGLLAKLDPQASAGRHEKGEVEAFIDSGESRNAESQILELSSGIESIENEILLLRDEKNRLRAFSEFDIDFSAFRGNSLEIIAGTIPNSARSAAISILDKLPDSTYAEKQHSRNSVILLVAARKGAQFSELSKLGFERLSIPKISSKPSKELERISARIDSLESEKSGLITKLKKLSTEYYSMIAAAAELCRIESSMNTASTSFTGTERTFVLEAFLPEENHAEFEKFAGQNFGANFSMRRFTPLQLEKTHEETPTLIRHKSILGPFEFLTRYMSLPRNNELDPTMMFLIFFPIFYGMMVGDAFYGLISLAIAIFIMKKTSSDGIMHQVSKIWVWGAIPTIFFGLVFDEFAGMPHEKIFEVLGFGHVVLYHGIERMDNIEVLLPVTILMGVFTMAFGFLLGFLNAMRHRNKKHAIVKLGWFGVVVFGTVMVSTLMFRAFPEFFLIPSAALFAISLAPILIVEGPIGALEVSSVLGNILSFARILAVGLVGVVIALILNQFAFPSPEKGLLMIVLLPLFILGHVLNAFIAMFEAFIQGARLNYVEFYSKFFDGGGKEFTPFKLSRKFIKDEGR